MISIEILSHEVWSVMAKRLKKHIHTLHVLESAKPNLRKTIIQNGDNELIKCLSDCAHNIRKGHIKLTPIQEKCLSRHCRFLDQLTNNKTSLKQKRKVLQKGGFLPALLAPIIGVLGSIYRIL